MHAGIATHFCKSKKIPQLEKLLLTNKDSSDVEGVIDEFCPKSKSKFNLSKNLDQINKIFSGSTMEEIVISLEKDNSEWAKRTIQVTF